MIPNPLSRNEHEVPVSQSRCSHTGPSQGLDLSFCSAELGSKPAYKYLNTWNLNVQAVGGIKPVESVTMVHVLDKAGCGNTTSYLSDQAGPARKE